MLHRQNLNIFNMISDFEKLKQDIQEKERTRPADEIKKKIPIPDHVPVGNHLAHFIRSIHWNSRGMFPSSAGSQRTYDKYNTVTSLSFSGPGGFHIEPGEVEGTTSPVSLITTRFNIR